MQHATCNIFEAAKVAVNVNYGTFQCKIRHSLAQTMAVCVFCQKVQCVVKIIDRIRERFSIHDNELIELKRGG